MCTGAFYRAGGKVLIFALSQDELRGKSILVKNKYKPFVAEPEGYSAADFLHDRDQNIVVAGGYMKEEVLKIIQPLIKK